MAAIQIPLNEVVHFDVITSSSTGAAADADATPTFAVYEESTDTDIGIGGNFTKRTSLTGNYRASFTASAANGFEVGKWYTVVGSATVGSVAGKCIALAFRVTAAETVEGVSPVNVTHVSDDSSAADNLEAACDGTGYNLGNGAVVAASVTGAVGSVAGAVGSVTSPVTAGTVSDKTGYSLTATTGLGNQTANITGNLSGSVNSVTTEVSANVTKWLGTAPATPTVAGVPEVDLTHINGTAANGSATVDANLVSISGDTAAADNLEAACDGTGFNVGAGAVVAASVTATVGANVVSVSGDTTAADNLEAAYDGTGYAGGTILPKVDLDTIKTQAVTCAAGVTVPATLASTTNITSATVDVTKWNGTNVATPSVAGVPEVDITHVGGSSAAPAGTVNATVVDKTGYKLASDGLDSIATTAPSGAASNFREMLVQVWRRFFKKATKTDSQLVTFADDGTTPITTQTINDDGSTETQGAA